MNIFKRNGTTSLSSLAKATVSTLVVTMLMAVSHPVFATTIEQSIEAAIGQSQKLEAERQKYISIRQSLGLATASNDLQANLVIKGSNTSTDRNNSTASATGQPLLLACPSRFMILARRKPCLGKKQHFICRSKFFFC